MQGFSVLRPKIGTETLVFGVEGKLYTSQFPFKSYTPLLGAEFSPIARQLYFKQVEQSNILNPDGSITFIQPRNLLVIQDGGFSPAAVFDGTAVFRSTGPGAIPLGGPMEWVGDRLWVARNANVFASDLGNPLSFTEPLYIAGVQFFVFSQEVTALTKTLAVSDFSQLLVFTRSTTSLLQANIRDRTAWPTTPGFQKELFPQIGCVSQRSIVFHHGFLWWFAEHGITSLDAASQGFVTSSLEIQDDAMSESKARLYDDLRGVASASYENYMLTSVPYCDQFNRHTWVIDNGVFKKADTRQERPAWQGWWSGTRPVEWLTGELSGETRCLYISVDYDGDNRLWEAFVPDRLDDGCPITCWAELRGFSFDSLGKNKDFRYAEIFMSELLGDVDIAVFWAGSHRGRYKRILTKRIRAAEGTLRAGINLEIGKLIFALKKQSRPLRTEDGKAIIELEKLSSCDVESPRMEFRDESFQLLIVWSALAAVRLAIVYAEPPLNEDDAGACEEDETEENFVRFDGAASEAPDFESALAEFSEDLPVFFASSTQSLTRDGFTEIGVGSSESVISQADADKIASTIARRMAAVRLEAVLPLIVSRGGM